MTLRLNAPRRWRLRRHGLGGKGARRHSARLVILLGAAMLSLGMLAGTAAAASRRSAPAAASISPVTHSAHAS
mgnify:CR=1 FL=1